MGRLLPFAALWTASLLAGGQTPTPPPDEKPLPPIRELLLDVERNQRIAEARTAEYTYRVHLEQVELDGKGNVKKTTVVDSESIPVEGVRVDRVIARNGKPLTPEEDAKETERVNKAIEKAKERRAAAAAKGQQTSPRGNDIISASRILELGTFTNPRRQLVNGRSTIVFDYAGDKSAKTHSEFEGIVRDLVGTVWIDEQDHVLVRAQGHFLNDFKIAGGLVLNIHKGLSFSAQFAKVNGEVWLPTVIEGQGSARILLVDNSDGRIRIVTSDYQKYAVTTDTGAATVPGAKPVNPPTSTPPAP
jgi:hypothetical protein